MTKALFFFTLLIPMLVSATQMDLTTYDQVIEKLESSSLHIKDKETQSKAFIRLADLYADKARKLQMQEVEKNCNNCLKSKETRNKAISYYQKSFKSAHKEQAPRILLQIAHLYSLNSQINKTERVFRNIIRDKKRYSSELVGEAYAGLGEIEFSRAQYKKAKFNFNKALKRPIGKPEYVTHRLAWCYFNEGKVKTAKNLVIKTLKNKSQLKADMIQDLSRDLATFTARTGITKTSIKELMNLTPENQKKANLFYLGKEADRLGNRKGALIVWAQYTQLEGVSNNESLEILLRTAQNLWDQGSTTASLQKYKEFYNEFGTPHCKSGSVCAELKDRSRNYIHTWIKKEKANPSKNLQLAIKVFTDNNPKDIEMLQWGGHIARYNLDYLNAKAFYSKASEQAHKQDQKKALKSSLLAEVQSAEDSEKHKAKKEAYEHFLKLSNDEKKKDEIRYQLAYLYYDKKNFKQSEKRFNSLALESKLNGDLKLKSADLSLDSLAALKNKKELEKRALQYAKLFKSKRIEFFGIARRAGVNIALETYKGNADKALKKLVAVNLIGASKEEKLNFYRNKILVAETAKDLDAVDSAAKGILNVKGISNSEREYALSKRLLIAESQFKFKSAHTIAKKMKLHSLRPADRSLKRALLAELAGYSSKKHYDDYIKKTPSRRKANVIRAKYVLESRRPWKTINKYKWKLLSTPDVYSDLLVDIYAKHRDSSELEKHIKIRKVRNTASGKILKSYLDLKEMDQERINIRKMRLNKRTDSLLAKSLQNRVKKLGEIDRKAKRSVRTSRFPVQVRYYQLLSKEYRRLYNEVMALPAPKGLTKLQSKEYKKLLKRQAEPFLAASENSKKSEEKLWDDSQDFKQTLKQAQNVRGGQATLLKQELKALHGIAGYWDQRKISSALNKIEVPSLMETKRAYKDAKNNPFDNKKLAKLKELESRRGRRSMVTFLEAKIIENKGVK